MKNLRGPALVVALCLFPAAAWAQVLAVPTHCQTDPQSANDNPGQKDLTLFCTDVGDGAPWEVHSIINADDIHLSGANTLDLCSLYDTNADGKANLAVCVTLESSGAATDNLTELKELRLLRCDDSKADRCAGSVPLPGPHNTTCQVSHPDNDPFGPASKDGPGDDYPYDTQVLCAVDLDDFAVVSTGARLLLDACSYPSAIPNSDPSECVLFANCSQAGDCDDRNTCTSDSCAPGGFCLYQPAGPVACSDGLYCTGEELCGTIGFCEAAGARESCDDAVECTIDACDELHDSCLHDPRNSRCDDGGFCNGVETCDVLVGCQAGVSPDCGDSVPCTTDRCNAATGDCEHAAVDAACDDGGYCNGTETCSAELGCLQGPAPSCDDGVPCTVDSCDTGAGACVRVPTDALCGDGSFCNGAESCDPAGGCMAGVPVACDDGVECTADSCEELARACANEPRAALCGDGLFCDGIEICDSVVGCETGTPPCPGEAACDEAGDACLGCSSDIDCGDGLYCNGAETCDRLTGNCSGARPRDCDDGVACTRDTCDETADACRNSPNSALCDNGVFCDGAEACNPATGCDGGPAPSCDDAVDCTVDFCIESARGCGHDPTDSLCDDGLFCDGQEKCSTEGCRAGEPVICAGDAASCSDETCDEARRACAGDFARCICGDLDQTGLEECDPPNRAGSFEDCNNGIDDDLDGKADCADPSCQWDSGRVGMCDEGCAMDLLCARIGRDPAVILYNRGAGPDSMWVHGRFPIESPTDPTTDGLRLEVSNGIQPVYMASLGAGDLHGSEDGRRFEFRDSDAKTLGAQSAREGLARVTLRRILLNGEPYLAFRVKVYGDFSAATRRWMTTQITIGAEVASLNAPWSASPGRWYLRQQAF